MRFGTVYTELQASVEVEAWRNNIRLTFVYTHVYTERAMADRAKIFNNGGSQAVRLPKSCRFPEGQGEVVARRVGKKVVLEPADEWPPEFIELLGSWPDEIERPPSRKITEMKDPFA